MAGQHERDELSQLHGAAAVPGALFERVAFVAALHDLEAAYGRGSFEDILEAVTKVSELLEYAKEDMIAQLAQGDGMNLAMATLVSDMFLYGPPPDALLIEWRESSSPIAVAWDTWQWARTAHAATLRCVVGDSPTTGADLRTTCARMGWVDRRGRVADRIATEVVIAPTAWADGLSEARRQRRRRFALLALAALRMRLEREDAEPPAPGDKLDHEVTLEVLTPVAAMLRYEHRGVFVRERKNGLRLLVTVGLNLDDRAASRVITRIRDIHPPNVRGPN